MQEGICFSPCSLNWPQWFDGIVLARKDVEVHLHAPHNQDWTLLAVCMGELLTLETVTLLGNNIWTIRCTWLPGSNNNALHSRAFISQNHPQSGLPLFVLPLFTHQDTYHFPLFAFPSLTLPTVQCTLTLLLQTIHTFIFSCPYRMNLTSILTCKYNKKLPCPTNTFCQVIQHSTVASVVWSHLKWSTVVYKPYVVNVVDRRCNVMVRWQLTVIHRKLNITQLWISYQHLLLCQFYHHCYSSITTK